MPTLVDDRIRGALGVETVRHPNGDVTVYAPFNLDVIRRELYAEKLRLEYCRLTGQHWLAGAAAGTWTFTNGGRTSLLDGTFDIDTDSFKVALHTSTSNIGAASTTWAGVTQEVTGNGYTAGGEAVTLTLSGTTTVTVAAASNPSWTASGGDIVARFAVLYEVAGNVLAYVLLDATPADVTIQNGNSLTLDWDGTPAIFTLS